MNNNKPVALITGASRGIGRAIALSLAEQNYNLALLARDEKSLTTIAKQCEAQGIQVLPLSVDVKDKILLAHSITQLMQYFGRLDTFICNQGIYNNQLSMHEDHEDRWEDTMLINLHASMYLTRLVLPHIMNAPASLSRSIIFMASIAAKMSAARNAAYCASKHGLLGFANSVFEEVRKYPIKISSICPGFVNTKMINQQPGLIPEKMIQINDVVATVNYILMMPTSCCPVEIVLKPQLSPYKNKK